MRRKLLWSASAVVAGVACLVGVYASDHDDGETNLKARALNLTDLYVFREGDQTGVPADNANLIFIMCTNPRSVARQQYYFATNARYEFHVSRRGAATDPVTASEDVLLRLEFGAPDASKQQAVTVTAVKDGGTSSTSVRSDTGAAILTTPLGSPDPAPIANPISLDGSTLTVYAGLREDPFFFDVESFFRVRAALRGEGPAAAFKGSATAPDFTAGYNVNAIVVRVPIAWLAGASGATTFDVWETISVLQ